MFHLYENYSGVYARNRKIKLEIFERFTSDTAMSENNDVYPVSFFFREIQFFVEMNPVLRTKIVLLFERVIEIKLRGLYVFLCVNRLRYAIIDG